MEEQESQVAQLNNQYVIIIVIVDASVASSHVPLFFLFVDFLLVHMQSLDFLLLRQPYGAVSFGTNLTCYAKASAAPFRPASDVWPSTILDPQVKESSAYLNLNSMSRAFQLPNSLKFHLAEKPRLYAAGAV